MAAYAALVSLSGLIDRILPRTPDYAFLCNKDQLESLQNNVIRLQEFIEHVSVRSSSSTTLDELEGRIRDAAYQLDYIIESAICRLIEQGFESDTKRKSFSSRLGSTVSCIGGNKSNGEAGSNPSASMAPLSAVFSSCIVEICTLLEEATKVKNIHAKKHTSATLHSSTTSSSKRTPIAKVDNVGLNEDIAQLLGTITSNASNLQIIPITGMGGIGKTTLARAVYDDSSLLHHFDVRLWVTISQEYDIQEVLRRLLPTEQQTQPGDRLIEQVYKTLTSRRFLIVLDDIWEGKAWDGVMNAFPDDNNQSRIILTTRQLGVASYVGSLNNVHEMQLLDEDQSWVMLREKVYGEEPCPVELGDIGKTISKNCKGLPLAIVVIAGLLKRNRMKDYWEEVVANTSAVAATDYDQLFGILSLSYTNLPPQLKACFLHVGAFPEDHEFKVLDLTMLWTAEGFIKPRDSKTMEDIAEEYIEELAYRSLILVKTKTYNSKIETFSIHDVLREVSIKKAKEEKFLQQNRSSTVQNIKNDQHHVSFLKNDLNFHSDTCNAHVRSFTYTIREVSEWKEKDYALLRKIGRVVYSQYDSSRFAKCPTSLSILCNTTSLRYLYVVPGSNGGHLKFPKSISHLQNLETFITRNNTSEGSTSVPLDIWKLQRLRHIDVNEKCNLQFPVASERGYPILESLQTLIGVTNVNFSMDVVERIPNVKRMGLCYNSKSMLYNNRRNRRRSLSLSNLLHLHQLEELSIDCSESEHILSDLAFPQNLKKLSLLDIRVPLENFMSTIGMLPNLEFLRLWSIRGDIWEPDEEEFLQLKYLQMMFVSIKEWRVESFHFPCLQKLEIFCCLELKEVPECIGEIDTLEELVLAGCPVAKASVEKIRDNQQAFGNDSLKITIE